AEVRVYDVGTGRQEVSFRAHAMLVAAVAFSRDGRRLATAGWPDPGDLGPPASAGAQRWRNVAKVWDARTGAKLRDLDGHTNLATGAAFSPDGRLVATASQDATVRLWDAETGQELLLLPHKETVHRVCFSPDGRLLASVGGALPGRQLLRLWDGAPLTAAA